MLTYLLTMKLISKHQHGFLMRHSTCTQLLECVQDWSIAIKNKHSMDTLYVDYSRAFDSVVHSKLLNKLLKFGIHDALFTWIKAFLMNRSQCVIVENCCSKSYDVMSGVPQGSVLGPLLFLLFVNDMVDIFEKDVTCKLFADDVKIYSVIDNSAAISPLTNALESLCAWSLKWQLSINIPKCNVLHLGKKNPRHSYIINGNNIQPAEHLRDLGVEIDGSLAFDHHIANIIKKAYQRIAILFKGFVSRDSKLLTRAYIVYIRPILEYCSSVWSPYLLKHIDSLEKVQRYFTRNIHGLRSFSYKDRLLILNLESLELRRLKNDLLMYYKVLHNCVDLDKSDFFNFAQNDYNTRGHNLKLKKFSFSNNCLENTFSNRCINCWNWLPNDVVNCSSISSFRAKLKIIDFSDFLKGRALVDV